MTQHNKMFPASPSSQIKWFTWILGPCSFLNIKRYPSKSLRTGSGASRKRRGGAETYNPFLVHYSPLSSISSKVLSTSSLSLYASSCDHPSARLRAFPLFTSLLPSSSLLTPASARAVSCFVQNLSLGTEILSQSLQNTGTYITWIRIGLSTENAVCMKSALISLICAQYFSPSSFNSVDQWQNVLHRFNLLCCYNRVGRKFVETARF